ncbi:MAG: DUF1292 domain-containing protein [Lachnospiraceae bacterium]|nr:DUF1292 domain-containing protein [Lachnospiraceae bacterium]
MDELETIVITFDDGEEADFYVLEQTQLMGVNYYLVTPADEEDESEEAECYILKEHSDLMDKKYGTYEFVEDEKELESVGSIFGELLEDSDMEVGF